MQVALARAILADGRLDAELTRRRWFAADGGVLAELSEYLERQLAELEKEFRSGELDLDEVSFHEITAQFWEFAEAVAILDRATDAPGAPVSKPPPVRLEGFQERLPAAPKSVPRTPRVQSAVKEAPVLPPEPEGWYVGVVQTFDQIRLTGMFSYNGDKSSEGIPISLMAFRNSGMTNLFANQQIEARIAVRADGRREVVDLKLAAPSRAGPIPINQREEALRGVRERYYGWGR